MVKSNKEAKEVASRLQLTAKDFLGIDINMAGYILKDFHVEEAVKMGMPFVISHPDCEASKCVAWIAKNIFNPEGVDSVLGVPSGRGIKAFCMRLLKQFQLR
jgi:flagellar biosynthesis protein FlhG